MVDFADLVEADSGKARKLALVAERIEYASTLHTPSILHDHECGVQMCLRCAIDNLHTLFNGWSH
jgi:hypothetical protein